MNDLAYTLFISDLHLDSRNTELTHKFVRLLQEHQQAEAIYILGDFFNAFIGEDDTSAFIEQIKACCRQYTQIGGQLYIMSGNRDFLMQQKFSQSISAMCIPDPTIKTIYGLRILMLHGDSLCTDDHLHQRWRRLYSKKGSHRFAHWIPLKIRQHMAKRMRGFSSQRNQKQSAMIMDV